MSDKVLTSHEDIKLDDVIEHLDISKSYFSALFRKETGNTFTEYLNKIRINYSKDLLFNTNRSLLDIALSVGFNNQNYFNIVFKKFTGYSPSEYRNEKII